MTEKSEHPINSKGWTDVYSEPNHQSIARITAEELSRWIKDESKVAGKDFLIVDVRRADCESMVPTSINLPAHTFPLSLSSLLPLLQNVDTVVFYCGSSNGRGPRCAGWYADAYRVNRHRDPGEHIKVLEGGIKGWEKTFGAGSLHGRGKDAARNDLRSRQA